MDAPGSDRTGTTFTGQVWGDPVLAETDGVLINTVCFSPGARTHWHTHHGGQVLLITAGQGRMATRDGRHAIVRQGDVVFFGPDEEHWHGADDHTFMAHVAISLGGHDWGSAVTDEEYAQVTA